MVYIISVYLVILLFSNVMQFQELSGHEKLYRGLCLIYSLF